MADLNRQPMLGAPLPRARLGRPDRGRMPADPPTYLDDRFELFGKAAILEYVDALTGGPAWDAIRDRDRIDLVWVKPDRGLAKRLYKAPGWAVLHQDKVSALFGKNGTQVALADPPPVPASSRPPESTPGRK